jgi:hypothetical protein
MYTTVVHSSSEEGRLGANIPQVVFTQLWEKGLVLHPIVGFRPIRINIQPAESNRFPCYVRCESALPPFFYKYDTKELEIRNFDKGLGTLVQKRTASSTSYKDIPILHAVQVCAWNGSDISILGDAGLLVGNRLKLPCAYSTTTLIIYASGSKPLKTPVLKIRRAYDSDIIDEVLGIGDGTKTEFNFSLANAPICPSSIKITFTGSSDTYLDGIRDNGYGKFGSVPTEFFALNDKESLIDYRTGKGVLHFSPDFVPKNGTNILVSYEYASDGKEDQSSISVNWDYEQ